MQINLIDETSLPILRKPVFCELAMRAAPSLEKHADCPAAADRRAFLLRSLGATLVVSGRTLGLAGATAPSNRITLGFIGVGNHGLGYNLRSFLEESDAQVVAVCDVFADRRKKARETVEQRYAAKGCREYADFRELLGAGDIDAVVISTPDHWHVPIAMLALEAGRDVFCEKPTLTIAEGRALVNQVALKKAVYQVGIEDRSVIQYHMLAGWARNGAIGKLRRILVKLPAGDVFKKEDPVPVPEGLDYNMWTGPAPFSPYTPTRTDPQQWRNIRDYAGGKLADWGAHLIDTAQVANFSEGSGPVEVEGEGEIPKDSMTTMPVNYRLRYRYANGVEMLVESGGVALRLEGTTGWVGNNGWRGRLEASDPSILHVKYPPETSKLWPLPPSEHRNFLDCIKSRKPTTYTAEAGHRLSTVMHVGNIAIELGRKLRWDPGAEAFIDDEAANKLRSRPARDDWKVS